MRQKNKMTNKLINKLGIGALTLALAGSLNGCRDIYEQKIKKEQEKLKLTQDSLAIDNYLQRRIANIKHKTDSILPESKQRWISEELNQWAKQTKGDYFKSREQGYGYSPSNDEQDSEFSRNFMKEYRDVETDLKKEALGISPRVSTWFFDNLVEGLNNAKCEYSNFKNEFSQNPGNYQNKYKQILNKK